MTPSDQSDGEVRIRIEIEAADGFTSSYTATLEDLRQGPLRGRLNFTPAGMFKRKEKIATVTVSLA